MPNITPHRQAFADTLKELRQESGDTMETVGDRINSTRVRISYWESAKRSPYFYELLDIAKAYNVTPNKLVSRFLKKCDESV